MKLLLLCILAVLAVERISGLPVEQCSEVCALNFTLNCASDGKCLKAFSNSCDLEFYNCRNDENFKAVDVEYCKSSEAPLCGEDDQYVVAAYL